MFEWYYLTGRLRYYWRRLTGRAFPECEERNEDDGLVSWCDRMRGHRGHLDGLHEDIAGRRWPVSK